MVGKPSLGKAVHTMSSMSEMLLSLARDAGTAPFTLAYLDAGTGSIVFQWIVAGLLGGAFALKMSWRRIAVMFNRKKRVDGDND
jgi:hypothetical protein